VNIQIGSDWIHELMDWIVLDWVSKNGPMSNSAVGPKGAQLPQVCSKPLRFSEKQRWKIFDWPVVGSLQRRFSFSPSPQSRTL